MSIDHLMAPVVETVLRRVLSEVTENFEIQENGSTKTTITLSPEGLRWLKALLGDTKELTEYLEPFSRDLKLSQQLLAQLEYEHP